MISLKKIDLSKCNDCEHPDIKTSKSYLVKYDGNFYAGQFYRVWYGWNFNGIYPAGAQLSYDGWQEIYEISQRTKRKKNEKIKIIKETK